MSSPRSCVTLPFLYTCVILNGLEDTARAPLLQFAYRRCRNIPNNIDSGDRFLEDCAESLLSKEPPVCFVLASCAHILSKIKRAGVVSIMLCSLLALQYSRAESPCANLIHFTTNSTVQREIIMLTDWILLIVIRWN